MPILLLASSNPGKLVEMRSVLGTFPGVTLLTGDAFADVLPPPGVWLVTDAAARGIALEVEEDGETYAENAARKAKAYCRASGLITLADDSGLEVDALGGEPGMRSHRYAPQPGASDADRRAFLLGRLQDLPQPWVARFRCHVAVAVPVKEAYSLPVLEGSEYPTYHSLAYTRIELLYSEGFVEGEIIPEERGTNGFGYDPIFLLPQLGRTMAELSLEEKNSWSHRGRALAAAVPILNSLAAQQGD